MNIEICMLVIYTMPLTEAQKRAQKKWKEANKERYNAYRNQWQKTKEGYREKQLEYVKKCQRRKRDFLAEVKQLLAIDLF